MRTVQLGVRVLLLLLLLLLLLVRQLLMQRLLLLVRQLLVGQLLLLLRLLRLLLLLLLLVQGMIAIDCGSSLGRRCRCRCRCVEVGRCQVARRLGVSRTTWLGAPTAGATASVVVVGHCKNKVKYINEYLRTKAAC